MMSDANEAPDRAEAISGIDISKARVLVVDDIPANLNILIDALEPTGYDILAARSGEDALESARNNHPDLILLDVMMPGLNGYETCARLKGEAATQNIPVIFVTARDEVESILEGFKVGGVDYLTKPVKTEEVLIRVQTHLKLHFLTRELQRKNRALKDEIDQRKKAEARASRLSQREAERWGISGFVGQSEATRRVIAEVAKVQQFGNTNVLISGESGTGKELIARAIHYGGPRLEGPFIAVNCSAIPADLAESSFFGHVRGGFTGATSDHKGYFEQANEGTLFLDEIGDMPLGLQAKLLRVLEDGVIVPVGSERKHQIQVRVLAGTNVELQSEIEAGTFRKDLYFRLASYLIHVPPLRQRREDIPMLAEYFLRQFASEMGMAIPRLHPEAQEALLAYDFPGNVRELKNLIERSLIESGGGEITPAHLHFAYSIRDAADKTGQDAGARSIRPPQNHRIAEGSDEQKILEFVHQNGSINNTECRQLLSVGLHRACYLLRKLHRTGLLQRDHSRKSAQYFGPDI